MNEIKLCLLHEYSSIEICLMELFNLSKQRIKKFNLNKKFLKSQGKAKQELSLPINLVNYLKVNPIYTGSEIEILSEDNYFLVLNKPHRVHMHPLNYNESDNLLSYLRSHNSKLLNVNLKSYDRGLIYRLDYETSGIVYYAKESSIYDFMRDNFHNVMEEKSYFAIVNGKFNKEGTHIHFLKPTGEKGLKMKAFEIETKGATKASLKIELIDQNNKYSLIKIYLKSGLRHQIRCQLAHLGFPIIGDNLYGGECERRLFLHAFQYKFKYHDNTYELKCEPDSLFKSFFNSYR